MIEPVARCGACFRDIISTELTEWAQNKTLAAKVWWGWQVLGICDECVNAPVEEEEEVKSDGC